LPGEASSFSKQIAARKPTAPLKKPAAVSGPRADFFDDGFMEVICPTSQAFCRSLIYNAHPYPAIEECA
jgi:hypothetical protein